MPDQITGFQPFTTSSLPFIRRFPPFDLLPMQ
jgi:hypothetical protein